MAKKRTDKYIKPYRDLRPLNTIEKDSPALIQVITKGVISGTHYGDNYAVIIQDCNTRVRLHGKLNNPDSRRNALYKLNAVIDAVTQLRDHIQAELKAKNLKITKPSE